MTRDTMSCHVWLDMLADYLDGRLAPESKIAFQRHADACTNCAPLLAALRDGEASTEAGPDLTEAVLARTSGPACGMVERTLASREVAHLDMEHHAMVRRHLEHCPSCRALEAVLNWMVPLLPAMAEATPDHAFAADVIRATSPARGRQAWRVRVGEWWEHFTSVPLFELQAAYVGAALLVVVGTSSLVPTNDLATLLGSTEAQISQVVSQIVLDANAASVQLGESVRLNWDASTARLLAPVLSVRQETSIRYNAAAEAADSVLSDVKRFAGAVRDGDLVSASAHVREAQRDTKSLWDAIRHGGAPMPGTGTGEGAEESRTSVTNLIPATRVT